MERASINPIETFVGLNRLCWFGHLSRIPDTLIPKHGLKWTLTHGKRLRGHPNKNWMICVFENASVFSGEENNVLERSEVLAEHREFLSAGLWND